MEGERIGFADSDLVGFFFSKVADGSTARSERKESDQGKGKDAMNTRFCIMAVIALMMLILLCFPEWERKRERKSIGSNRAVYLLNDKRQGKCFARLGIRVPGPDIFPIKSVDTGGGCLNEPDMCAGGSCEFGIGGDVFITFQSQAFRNSHVSGVPGRRVLDKRYLDPITQFKGVGFSIIGCIKHMQRFRRCRSLRRCIRLFTDTARCDEEGCGYQQNKKTFSDHQFTP